MTAFADSKMNSNNTFEKIQKNHTYALIDVFDYEEEVTCNDKFDDLD